MAAKHWFEKIRKAHDEGAPLRLSPGEAGSLWKFLRELEIDTPEKADLRAAAGGTLRLSKLDGSTKD